MTPSSLSLNKDTVAPRLDDALESVNQMYPVGSVSTTRKMTHPLMVQLPVVSWKPRSSAFVKKTSDYRWSVKSKKGGGLLCQIVELRFDFIRQQMKAYPVTVLCKVMQVSRSGLYVEL